MLRLVEWQYLSRNVLTVQRNVSPIVPIDPTNDQIVRRTDLTIALLNVHQRNVLPTVSTVQKRRPLRLNKSKPPLNLSELIWRISTEKTTWKVPVAATLHLPLNTAKHITMTTLPVFNPVQISPLLPPPNN